MHSYALEDQLVLTEGSIEKLTLYQFHKKIIKHYFCPVCGVMFLTKAFGVVAVNVRTIDGIDLEKLKLRLYDGEKLL